MEKLTLIQKKNFNKTLLALGLPMVFQQFISSLINLLDTFMLGSVSEDVLTAAGLANKLFFVYILIIYGITTGAAIFIAQFFGKGDNKNAHKYLGISLILSTGIGIVFSLVAFFIPDKIMGIYTQSESVINFGVQYLKILSFSYIFTALSACFYTALKSMRHAYIPLAFTITSLITNFIFNSIFIYALNMGIKGAAYATLLARGIEFIALIITLKLKNTAISVPLKNYFNLTAQDFKSYFKVAGFVIMTEIIWSVGNALYAVAFRRFGTSSQAAIQVTDTCTMLFIVAAFALGNAAAVIMGNTIGEGDTELAIIYSRKFWILSIIAGIIIGAAIASLSPVLPAIFPELTAEGKELSSKCLLIMGLVMPLRCLEFMLMVGLLRSGGDTKFAVFCDITSVWMLTLPIMLLSSFVFNFPFIIVYVFMYTEMLYKCIVGSVRVFKNRKWLHNVTKNTNPH